MTTKTTDKPTQPLSDIAKQIQPLEGELDPKDAKTKVFLAAQIAHDRRATHD